MNRGMRTEPNSLFDGRTIGATIRLRQPQGAAISAASRLPGLRQPNPWHGDLRRAPAAVRSELAVQLLGPVHVAVGDTPVASWSSAGRARSLFAYLVTHRTPWPPSEVLMDVFWPGSTAPAARNSLHVAMHGLRRILRTATAAPVIVLAGDAYRVEPTLHLRLDVEEFDERLTHARRHEQRRDRAAAVAEYEAATAMYRGDFLAENPYDDWAAPMRERLRRAHLDALTQLSGHYFEADRYAECTTLCRRVLDCDPCSEDIRRRLMRCHSRRGQPHLALLEFRDCARILANELGIAPDPATVTLRDRISRREPV